MQKPTTENTESTESTENTETAADAQGASAAKVPFFARKQGRPAMTVRSGVHGGRESRVKAT